MIELTGDFWNHYYKYECLVCTVNQTVKNDGRLVMGAGIAKQFKNAFTDLDLYWGYQAKIGLKLFTAYREYKFLVGLPTKYHWKDDSSINLIQISINELKRFVDHMNINSVLMTQPGCGLGNLQWGNVKPILNLDNKYSVIAN